MREQQRWYFGIHSVATLHSLETVHPRTAAQRHLAGYNSFSWLVAEGWAAEPAISDIQCVVGGMYSLVWTCCWDYLRSGKLLPALRARGIGGRPGSA